MKRPILGSLVALVSASVPQLASAQEASQASTINPLGHPGQKVFQGDFQLSFLHQSTSAADGEDPDSVTSITIAPAFDFFVASNISLGGQVLFVNQSAGDSSITGFGAAPRAGYFLPLGAKLGLWPTVRFAYLHTSVDLGDFDASGYDINLAILAPLLFQPAEHFFIGLGPAFQTDLVSKVEDEDADKATTFGLQSTVGGYW